MSSAAPDRVHVGRRRSAGRCSSSRACGTSAGTRWSRSGSTRARCATASCSRSTATSPSCEVFEGTTGLALDGTSGLVRGQPDARPGRRGVARAGLQRPRRAARRRPARPRRATCATIGGRPINPAARATPRDPILTGVSVDRRAGDARPRPEAPDLLGRRPAAPRAGRPDRRPGDACGDEPFAVVFAAMGVTNADATAVRERAREHGRRRPIWSSSSTPPTTRSSSGSSRRGSRSPSPSTSHSTSAGTCSS